MIIAGTGHRPEKLGGYDTESWQALCLFARDMLVIQKPDLVITGMALGWDQALARACVNLKLPYHAYVPFTGQQSRWPQASQERYAQLLARAADVKIVCEGGYSIEKMQLRNEAMVDACDLVLALWNGSNGGTANCVRYAQRIHKPLKIVWPEWAIKRGIHA